ncbi:Cthe_2314 family HEPN domain-containing protein [Paenibacillus alkalitolerans]|uniref:Cthe_2314 family HEPN domain-containing protein n=1 Tax=Paenibacillus alkalitolerans TaxID=2799335 RepID=UPI0018F5A1C4|nr:Cthe_2314 family HEPN domain-containing protein [Paenibacillus alkalitolerans]
MLRFLFGESKRRDAGRRSGQCYDEVILLMERYGDRLTAKPPRSDERRIRLAMWVRSLLSTLYELEQSVYCSEKFAARVKQQFPDRMSADEYDDYRRHLFFFSNSFVRVFSALDKLGCFLNDQYSLQTEQVKERFSYFTVVRRMREMNSHTELQRELFSIKEKYQRSMHDLRLMRNHEIHGMNAQLLDEAGHIRYGPSGNRERIEDLTENGRKLRDGFQMVCQSLHAAFTYCNRH